jgi:putative phage-type endonuclease
MANDTRELRRQGVGGSDIAALAGQNKYRTAHDVWLEKVGYAPLTDDPPSEAAYWGLQLEEILCNEYARRENVRLVQMPFANGIARDPIDPWIQGSPDRLVDAVPLVGVDAKMAGLRQAGRFGEEGTDQIPDEYLLQCQWYLRLTHAVRWDLAVLLGQEFRIYRVEPHKALQDTLVEIARTFWFEHVIPTVPPTVDHTTNARRMLEAIYPMQQDEIRPATDEEVAMAREMRDAERVLQRAEMQHAHLRNLLCHQIGLAEGIAGPGFRFTWKRTRDFDRVDWQAVANEAMATMPDEWRQQIIRGHTTKVRGVRRFRATFHDDKEKAANDAY